MELVDIITCHGGTPQTRIHESIVADARVYYLYGQADLEADTVGFMSDLSQNKTVRTLDKVTTVSEGDIIFSLISGVAARVRAARHGLLYTQNYVLLRPDTSILNPDYLVYLLNSHPSVRRQLSESLQGSRIKKYTLVQLRSLVLPSLPTLKKQRLIADIYFKQLRLTALKSKVAQQESLAVRILLQGSTA